MAAGDGAGSFAEDDTPGAGVRAHIGPISDRELKIVGDRCLAFRATEPNKIDQATSGFKRAIIAARRATRGITRHIWERA